MPYLEIEGRRCYYVGDPTREGIPVVFCHGSGGGHHHWLYQLKKLPGIINPLAVDLPGHGRSEGSPKDEVAAYREWLHIFKITTGIGSFVPAGHSLGGAIALSYTLEYPSEVRGLILVGSGARLKVLPAFLDELRQGSIPDTLIDYLYSPKTPKKMIKQSQQEIEAADPAVYLADLSACDKFDVIEELSRIKQPTLMICGDEDRLTPVKYSNFLEERLKQGNLEVIEGAGHMVMVEKPDEVTRAITQFIEEAL